MTGSAAHRQAAREAIEAARRPGVRRRQQLPLAMRAAGEDAAEAAIELVAFIAFLVVASMAAAAVRWGWEHSPAATVRS